MIQTIEFQQQSLNDMEKQLMELQNSVKTLLSAKSK